MKILVEQEGIDINSRDKVCFIKFIFPNNIWNFFKLLWTALIFASENENIEILKILIKQKGINLNAKDNFYLNRLIFQYNK